MNAMMKMQLTELVEQIQRDHKDAAREADRARRCEVESDPYREGVRIAQRSAEAFRAALANSN